MYDSLVITFTTETGYGWIGFADGISGGNLQNDSRKVQRFIINFPAVIESHTGPSVDMNRKLISRDVSSGGAFFLTPDPLDVGTRLVVSMVLKSQHIKISKRRKARVTVGGRVLRKESKGMAVQFEKSYKITSVKA